MKILLILKITNDERNETCVLNWRLLTVKVELFINNVLHHPTVINDTFVDYYSELYTSESAPDDWDGPNPLDLLTYPQTDPAVAADRGAPVTVSEVQKAISSLQSNKSPGPDGFTTEFYKTYSTTLAPILVKVFNDARIKGLLPPTMSEASITLLL